MEGLDVNTINSSAFPDFLCKLRVVPRDAKDGSAPRSEAREPRERILIRERIR